jgi:hypothetical protein
MSEHAAPVGRGGAFSGFPREATAMDGAVDPVLINALIEKIGKNAAILHVVEHKYWCVTELGKQFANICVIRVA